MNLAYSSHTPHRWPRADALPAILQACETWPGYSLRAMPHGAAVLIFLQDERRQPLGWLRPAS